MGDFLNDAANASHHRQTLDSLPKRLRKLYDILTAKGLDLADVEASKVNKVGFWQAMHKDDETGEAVVTDLARIELSPAWEQGPEWPVIQPAARPRNPAKARRRKPTGWTSVVCLPDMQVGYFANEAGELEAIHDEPAIAVALEVVRDVDPDVVLLHGDNADFAELSNRFRLAPAFQATTQATINRCALLAQQLRAAAPHARLVWLEGNHEARLPFLIIDNAKAAFGLKRGFEPEGWPVMSLPHLCHFDDFGVEYESGYPANEFWLNDNLRAIHGHRVKANGSTAHLYLDDARVSTIFGHVHRRELAQRTRHTRHGPRTVSSMSFGCLARIDGVVPSTKTGIKVDGQPARTTEDWQQGIGVVYVQPGDGLHAAESIEIVNGWARWGGTEYGKRPKR